MSPLDSVSEARWWLIPEHMREPLRAYIEDHRAPGDFLRAVLRNDLKEAVWRADAVNLFALPAYVEFLTDHAPATSWGSRERYDAWVAACPQELVR